MAAPAGSVVRKGTSPRTSRGMTEILCAEAARGTIMMATEEDPGAVVEVLNGKSDLELQAAAQDGERKDGQEVEDRGAAVEKEGNPRNMVDGKEQILGAAAGKGKGST